MKILFLIFLFPICAFSTITLKEKISSIEVGDYIATEQKGLVTLLFLREKQDTNLIFEEISLPKKKIEKSVSWQKWINNYSPGHSSWLIYEIDLEKNKINECYSVSQKSFLDVSNSKSFFMTLLSLPLTFLEDNNRRRIGKSNSNKTYWTPLFILSGKEEKSDCDVYQANWPKDGTELANKHLELYFDKQKRSSFPHWIQAHTNHFSFIFRAIDLGKNLTSPIKSIPHLLPKFLPSIKQDKKTLNLSLSPSRYFNDFQLYALDITKMPKRFILVPFTANKKNDEFSFSIEKETLKKTLKENHKYIWLAVPKRHKKEYIEFPSPFVWKSN